MRLTICKQPEEKEESNKRYEFKSVVERCVRLWRQEDLPERYHQYVGELDDINWVALVPLCMRGSNFDIFKNIAFDSALEPKIIETKIGVFYVGRHGN